MYEGLTFCFDIDGTLCPIKKKDEEYIDLLPYKEMLDKLKEYKEGGAKIVLFTSRNMNSYGGNIGLINANTAKVLLKWLDKWEIPYKCVMYLWILLLYILLTAELQGRSSFVITPLFLAVSASS